MYSQPELEQICFDINDIAIQAGKRIKKYFNANYEITIKEDQSPVTTADLEANDYIVEKLHKLTPNIPILSEESAEFSYAERKHWTTFWLIDPLDGTRDFIKNRPGFSVNISLVHNNQSILGVIYLPIDECLYFASKDNGAFKDEQDNSPSIIQVSNKVASIIRVCASTHPGKSLQKFLNKLPQHQLISIGSSIKSCKVAEGSADIYPRFGPTWEWDTAAAQCIVEQAGGKITNLEFKALRYNKPSLLNPPFLVCGDPDYDWEKYIDQM
jgi:3'(2'), 5'-bisphosphate nucleotidase